MDILMIALIAVTGVITAVILKGQKQEFSIIVIIALSLIFLAQGIGLLTDMKSQLELIREFYEGNQYYYKILFKILGITYLCEFTTGICRDAGYQSIAGQVEILGKLFIMAAGMPVILAIVETLWNYQV